MNVKLISYTPDPERTVAAAARMCYSPVGAQRILEDFKDEEVEGFLRKILVLGHLSPTEHASFTFSITGSRVMTHQLVRHRIASYSQKSQRYISEGNFTYTTPPSIKANPEAEAVFKKAMEDVKNSYNLLIELGINREDARFVLPNACETNIICTFNTRSLYNFLNFGVVKEPNGKSEASQQRCSSRLRLLHRSCLKKPAHPAYLKVFVLKARCHVEESIESSLNPKREAVNWQIN